MVQQPNKDNTTTPPKGMKYEPMLATARFIDKHMKLFLDKNYIENYEYAKQLLIVAEIKYPATIKTIYEGLQEFMKAYDTKASLGQHLRMIGDLTCIGVNASIAGEKLKEALLKHWSK